MKRIVCLFAALLFVLPALGQEGGGVYNPAPTAASIRTLLAGTTSAQWRTMTSDESGTGSLLFGGGNIGAATGTSLVLSGSITSGDAVIGATFVPGNNTPYTFFRGYGANTSWPFQLQGLYDGSAVDAYLMFGCTLGSTATRAAPTFTNSFACTNIRRNYADGQLEFMTAAAGTNVTAVKALIIKDTGAVTALTTINTGGYIVSALPVSPGTGARAYVTDQLTTCAAIGAALTGGGAVVCPAFYNGSAWVGG